MNRSCVNCLKTVVTNLNFLCWLCGAFVVAFGEFQMIHSKFASLITTFWPIYPANTLVVTGTIVTCVCYLGVLGGMRENRCMLITFFILLFILMLVELAMACVFLVYSREIDSYFEKDLMQSLEIYRHSSLEGNKTIRDDFDAVQHLGCLHKLRDWFARNYLSTGSCISTCLRAGALWILRLQSTPCRPPDASQPSALQPVYPLLPHHLPQSTPCGPPDAGLVDAMNTGLEMCGLKNIPIVAQSYDGASVMSGQVSGVQQRIKEMHPYATYIHCLAHKLNLVLVDCCTVNRSVKTFLNVIGKLYSVFAERSNHHRFIEVQKSLNMKPTEIAQPSETRWACKWCSLHAVKTHYAAITQCLREMRDDGEKWSVEATGLYEHMARLSFITCLIVLEDILRVIHVTHKALQSSNLTLSEAAVLTENLKAHFVSQRQDDKWDDVWGLVKQFCRDNNISVSEDVNIQRQTPAGPEPVPPKRKRATQPPTALDSFLITTTLGHREETAVNAVQMSQSESHGFQQHLYFPVLDTIIGELDRRFTGEAVKLAQACAAVLRCDKNGIEPLIQKYAQPLKINHSLVGAEMDLVKASTVGDVTREHLQKTVTKAIYPNLYKMLQLALTLPVGSATSERSFSAM
ncbi:CD53 Cell surface glycoprotein [Collichthys lucidus]|uniref:CD53 Cell surface glycoprotein n=1 Tax=Collichthys lucidus TaxID=240159 RepID=A0A4U5UTZ9_COLLU|nr:CD53 Cell surface glycoprotein [Collichthys lucidus]